MTHRIQIHNLAMTGSDHGQTGKATFTALRLKQARHRAGFSEQVHHLNRLSSTRNGLRMLYKMVWEPTISSALNCMPGLNASSSWPCKSSASIRYTGSLISSGIRYSRGSMGVAEMFCTLP